MSAKHRDRFIKLAEKRVTRAINYIRLIGNLSNRSNYSYTDEEAEKIIKALETGVRDIKLLFQKKKNGEKTGFRLTDD